MCIFTPAHTNILRLFGIIDQDVQRDATHFKNRILDLVDLLVRKQSTNPLILQTVLPLLELATQSSLDERQLADKAKGILKNRVCKAKEVPSGVDADKTTSLLEKIHELAQHARNSEILATLGEASVFIARVSSDPEQCIAAYKSSVEDFASRKNSSLNPAFFQQYIKRFPNQGWALRDELLSSSSKSVNGYRACQMLQMLMFTLSSIEVRFLRCLPVFGCPHSNFQFRHHRKQNSLLSSLKLKQQSPSSSPKREMKPYL